MQHKVLTLLTLLAPLPAAAFGNLDCIAIESCGNGGCDPVSKPFAIDFDWWANAAIVTQDGTDHPLPWAQTGETDDGLASTLEYGDTEAISRFLRIEASGLDITAYYTFKDPSVTTWVGTCNVRKAA